MRTIQEAGVGIVICAKKAGIGLFAKVQAYHLQDLGYDTLDANLALGLPADARTYEMAASMLQARRPPGSPHDQQSVEAERTQRTRHSRRRSNPTSAGLGKHNIRYSRPRQSAWGIFCHTGGLSNGRTYLNRCKPHKKEATALTKDMIGHLPGV